MHDLRAAAKSLEVGGGQVTLGDPGCARLVIPAKARGYADAQVDDTQRRARSQFVWRPPVILRLRARASSPRPFGTLGFGFWNDPFAVSLGQGGAARRLPAPPRALWFFYGSPPNDLSFAPGIPGSAWTAMSLNSPAVPAAVLLPLALGAVALVQIRGPRRWIMTRALAMAHADQRKLDVSIDEWHEYGLRWAGGAAAFDLDGETILTTHRPASGPLGFVAWIDNQYAVASPEKGLRFGVIPTDREQWLEIEGLHLEAG